jgi:hypothetical protein
MPPARPDPAPDRHRCVRQAVIGTVVWIAWISATGFRSAEALLILSPLVLFPLVLRLAVDPGHPPSRAWWLASWLHLPGAVCLVASFALPRGAGAAALTIPWLLTTATTALAGVARLRTRGRLDTTELGIDAGLIFLVVGAAWAAAFQLGIRPLGFSDTIVLLTSEHFHYAGFILPVLATLVARERGGRWSWVVVAVVAGVPLTAIGITLSPVIEVAAALLVVAGGLAVAVGQLMTARHARSGAAALLGVSSMALAWAMVLAAMYAVGEFRGHPWPPIPDMIEMHGTANALGTALAGVWGWTVHRGVTR